MVGTMLCGRPRCFLDCKCVAIKALLWYVWNVSYLLYGQLNDDLIPLSTTVRPFKQDGTTLQSAMLMAIKNTMGILKKFRSEELSG